jgi:ankyrin repeat protein
MILRRKLYEAVGEGDINGLRELLEIPHQEEKYEELLLLALDRNFPEIATLLLENQANPNVPDDRGNTPLFYAEGYSNILLTTSLLQHKANPDIQNRDGKTVLHRSVMSENKELVQLLLEHPANPNVPDDQGNTPIFYTINAKIFTLLLEHNADIDLQNKAGDSIRGLLENPTLSKYNSHLRKLLNDYLMEQLQNIKVVDEGLAVTELGNQVNLLLGENLGHSEQDIS